MHPRLCVRARSARAERCSFYRLLYTGYELIEAENGEEAPPPCQEAAPATDGYEATRRIRTNPGQKAVPIYAGTSAPGLFR